MYNSTDNTWVHNIKSLPLPPHHASAAPYGGKIYLVWGYTGNWIPSNNLLIYDPATNNWTFGNPVPTPRYYILKNSKMLVILVFCMVVEITVGMNRWIITKP
jgi:hypothetical protein